MIQTYSQLMAPEELAEILKENYDSKNQYAAEQVSMQSQNQRVPMPDNNYYQQAAY